jgi:hypothetical protein
MGRVRRGRRSPARRTWSRWNAWSPRAEEGTAHRPAAVVGRSRACELHQVGFVQVLAGSQLGRGKGAVNEHRLRTWRRRWSRVSVSRRTWPLPEDATSNGGHGRRLDRGAMTWQQGCVGSLALAMTARHVRLRIPDRDGNLRAASGWPQVCSCCSSSSRQVAAQSCRSRSVTRATTSSRRSGSRRSDSGQEGMCSQR